MSIRPVVVLAAVVLALSGCGRSDPAEKTVGGKAGTKAEQAGSPEAVAAVMQSTGTPIARLGFVLVAKPVVGRPVELRLDVSATTTTALRVTAESETISLDPATTQADLAIAAGATVSHTLKLTPPREGLADVMVRLRTEDAETVYAIPVLVSKAEGA